MSSKKTDYLKMHDWTETDPWRLAEVSENFKKMDKKAKDLDTSMATTVSTAADAKTTANGIDAKATDALIKSTEAVQNVSTAVQKANSAETKATEAKTVSDNALAKAGAAESIANGVQTQFNQVVIAGDSSVEAAQARVNTSGQTYSTLKQRLDSEHQEVTVKLAEKAEKEVVQELVDNKAEKSDVRLNTDVKPINVSEMDTETKQLFTGGSVAVVGENAVGNENVKPKAITADKAAFLSSGINKFNGDFKSVSLLTDGSVSVSLTSKAAIIPIVGGKTYHFQKSGGNRRRIGWHKSNPIIANAASVSFLDYYIGDITDGLHKAPADATHLVYLVSFNEGLPNVELQITEDKPYPFFVGYDFLNISNIKELKKNFDLTKAKLYGVEPLLKINYSNKTLDVPATSRILYGGKRLSLAAQTFSFNDNTSKYYMALRYNPITAQLSLDYFFDSLPDSEHLLLAIINPVSPSVFGIDITKCEVDGEMFVPPQVKSKITSEVANIDIAKPKKYFFLDDITGVYEKPANVPDGSSDSVLNLVATNHTVIYEIFDSLVQMYPNVWAKTVVGVDASGLNINQYDFTSPRITNDKNLPLHVPKILMISAIHGYEQGTAYSTAMLFKDLSENWTTKPQLEFLYSNFDFKIIPVANPYGYDNNQRRNYNGIDLNRNVFTGTRAGNPEDEYFGGYTGMSEPETQTIVNFINTNLDAEYYIDYHNIASGYPLFYSHNETDRTIGNSLFKTLTKKWRGDHPTASATDMMGRLLGSIENNTTSYALSKRVKPVLFETPWVFPFANSKYDKISLESGSEALGNLFVTIAKSLR